MKAVVATILEALAKWQVIVAVTIAVAGWLVNHALTIRAQNKNFVRQVIDRARLEITAAIRECTEWLTDVHVAILTSHLSTISAEAGGQVNWRQRFSELSELFSKNPLKWCQYLEEYEILFPKTAQCRRSLLERQAQIGQCAQQFATDLLYAAMGSSGLEEVKKVIQKAQGHVGIVIEQTGLMIDLQIYLQNVCLSRLTGNSIPPRQPEDPSVPRLVEDRTGNLRILVPESQGRSAAGHARKRPSNSEQSG